MQHLEGTFKNARGAAIAYQAWLPAGEAKAVLLVVHGVAEHCGRYMNVVNHFVPLNFAEVTEKVPPGLGTISSHTTMSPDVLFPASNAAWLAESWPGSWTEVSTLAVCREMNVSAPVISASVQRLVKEALPRTAVPLNR